MVESRENILLQGLLFLLVIAIISKARDIAKALIHKMYTFTSIIKAGVEKTSLTGNKLAGVNTIVTAIILTATIAVIIVVLSKYKSKGEKCICWNLSIMNSSKAQRSLQALLEAIRDKSSILGNKCYIILGFDRGRGCLSLLSEYNEAIVDYYDSLLKTLAPEVKVSSKKIVNCPKIPIYTNSSSKEVVLAIPPLNSIEVSSRAKETGFQDENKSIDLIFFACSLSNNPSIPVGIKVEDLWRHTGVFGSTGSGKTTTAAVLAYLISLRKIPVVIIDWHGEYKSLLKNVDLEYINPLEQGMSFNPLLADDLESTINILEDVFALTQPQSATLYRLLKTYKDRIESLQDLLYILDSRDYDSTYWERELKQALVRKLEFIDSREGRILLGKGVSYKAPDRGLQLIDLSSISNYNLKKIVGLTIIRSLYENALSKNFGGKRIVLVIDEAHNIMPKTQDNFISRMIAEVRKYGIGFIIVTQSPSSINIEFLKNLNSKIIHSIRIGVDKKIIAESTDLGDEMLEKLSSLKPGEAIVSTPSLEKPVLAKVYPEILYGKNLYCI